MPISIDAGWHPLADGVPPRWASEWGQDCCGVYVAFSLGVVSQRLRWIPPGRFDMGSPDEEVRRWADEGPQHTVTIMRGFWMFDTVCTEALWEAVTGKPNDPRRGAMFPATGVSWDDAQSFIDQLNAAKKGLDLTLPTEAQWEYACRAGTPTRYHFDTEISKELVCYGTTRPVPVGSLPANAWGLHEMHGNVWEWCADHWHESYEDAPADGTAWNNDVGGVATRVIRGGSWGSDARDVRSAFGFASTQRTAMTSLVFAVPEFSECGERAGARAGRSKRHERSEKRRRPARSGDDWTRSKGFPGAFGPIDE